jgi:hypothetical protein
MAAHARDPFAARIAGAAWHCMAAAARAVGHERGAEKVLRRVIGAGGRC